MDISSLLKRNDNAGTYIENKQIRGARHTYQPAIDLSTDPTRQIQLQSKRYEWEDKTPNSRIYFSNQGVYLNPPAHEVPGLQSVPFPTEVTHVTEKLTETFGPPGGEFVMERPIRSQQYIMQDGVKVKRFHDMPSLNSNPLSIQDNFPIRPRPHVSTTWQPVRGLQHLRLKQPVPPIDETDLDQYTDQRQRFPPIPSQFYEPPRMPLHVTNDPIFQTPPSGVSRNDPFVENLIVLPEGFENIFHVFRLNGQEINLAEEVLLQEMNVGKSFPTDNREGMWQNYAWTEQMLKESLKLPNNTLFSARSFMILAVFFHKKARLYLPSFTKNFAKVLDENKKRIESFLLENEVEVLYKDQFYLLKPPKTPSRIFSLQNPTPYFRKQLMDQLMF